MPNWKKVITSGSAAVLSDLTLSGVTQPEIKFNGTSDAGVDFAIRATPEGLDFYEPEDSNKIHMQIIDDGGVDAKFGLKIGGTSVLSSGRALSNVTGNISMFTNNSGYVTTSGNTIIGTDSDITTSGATVIDDIYMTDGVITSHTTRTLTLANLGYTGATDANKITNTNQLTNGAGFLTSYLRDMGSGFIVANNGGTSQFTIVEDNALRFAGTGATTVSFNSTTKKITIDSTNTEYSVGDGGLTQKNFTSTLKTKLDGIATGATANTGTMSSWIIKEGNGSETATVTNGETVTIEDGTGIQSELTSTSSGGTITITNTAPAGATHLNSNTTKSDVGLSNVANESRATILGGNLTGTINSVAVATVTAGAAAGATANQDSTSTIRSGTTKANVGLGSVDNKSSATIRGEITSANVTSALGFTPTANTGDITGVTAGTGLSGGASSGTATLNSVYLPAVDDRDMKPNTSGVGSSVKGIKPFFTSLGGMTGTANTDYQDALVLDTYSDSSGGNANCLIFDKSSFIIKHYNAASSATTWGTPKTIAYTSDIPSAANNATITISAGNALTTGGNFTTNQGSNETITIHHADTSTQSSVNNSGNTVIQDVTLDTYGHVTGLTSKSLSIPSAANNATITINAGNALTTGGNFTTNQSSDETITIHHGDTSSQSSVNGSGRTYIQDITLDTYGHVTGIGTATETVTNSDTIDMGDGFIIEDGDGTEVRITENKEVKFVEGTGIDINWTDTSNGSDGDPYDLTITNTAPMTGDTFDADGTFASLRAKATTKGDVGLGNVTNESKTTMFSGAALTNNPTAPTQTAGNDSTRIATTAFVGTAIDNLIGGAPGALDTLDEIAAALNDDADLHGTLTTSIGAKLPKSGGTMTGAIAMGNQNITGINNLVINDPGPNEGISWNGGNMKIYESPNDLTTNTAGNLQIVYGTTRRLTIDNTGINVNGNAALSGFVLDGNTITGVDDSGEFTDNDAHIMTSAGVDDRITSRISGLTSNAGTMTGITINTATGLDGAGSLSGTGGTINLSLDLSELTDMTADVVGSQDELILLDSGAERRKMINEIKLSQFNNDSGFTSHAAANNATITISAGNALTTGGNFTTNQGSNETITIHHADTSTQSSVDNSGNTVIQDVTLDGYGHVTGLTSKTLSIPTVNNATLTLSTSAGLDGSTTFSSNQSSATTFNVSLDLSELTDKTDGIDASVDEIIMLDNGAERRKRFSEIFGSNAYNSTTIPSAANNATITISAGNALTTGGAFTTNQGSNETITIHHADTSTQGSINNSGNTVIQDVTLDGYGHVTGLTSKTLSIPTVNNATLTVQGTGALGGSGTFTANQSSNTTISISHDDTSTQASSNNSNGTVIQDVTLDGYGHVTGLGTYNLDGRYYTESESDANFLGISAKAADSNLLDGLDLHTGRNNNANKVVRTNGSGYAEFGWINTTSGNTTNSITDIYVNTNDGYIRKASKSEFQSQMGIQNVLSNTDIDTGTEVVTSAPLSSYSGYFFDYVVSNDGNFRAGTVTAVEYNGTVEFTETSTADIGNTSDLTLHCDASNGSDMKLMATATSNNWSVKVKMRLI